MSILRLGIVVACVSGVVLPATAVEAASRKAQFAIPAGAPLDRALTMFSAQSDRDILFTPAMVEATGIEYHAIGRLGARV